MTPGRLLIGTSGYQYDHWKGIFYPRDLPKSRWLPFFAEHYPTVEINNSFYRLPESHTFESWREQAPAGFVFAVKFSRYGTHMKRLRDPEGPVNLFVERARSLGKALGPVLVQLPPNWEINPPRLAAFLDVLPSRWRWVVEFRDPTWLAEPSYSLLRKHRVALCLHDRIPGHPRVVTADWVYYRFHGGPGSEGAYPRDALQAVASEIARHIESGRDVYAYFNNDWGGHALRDADTLRALVPVAVR